jgi:hypothetical protein
MGLSTILIITLAAGVVLVVGGGLVMYMANLVKSAYEIKVQINSDVDERLTKMGDDLDKKSKWIKRDLLEELDKIKSALYTENATKIQGLTDPLLKRLDVLENSLRGERGEWVKAVDSDRQNLSNLDTRLKQIRRDVKRIEDKLGLTGAAEEPAAGGPTAPKGEPPRGEPAKGDAARTEPAQTAKPAAKTEPAKATGPYSGGLTLPDLG